MNKRYRWNKKIFFENMLTLATLVGSGIGLGYLVFLWMCDSIGI